MVHVIVTTPKPFKINYENSIYIFQKKNVIKWELVNELYVNCKNGD
jgi:hypothetical protein